MQRQFVPHTPEVERVLHMPRRDWNVGSVELAARVTDVLRTQIACRVCGGWREHGRPNGKPCELRRIPLSLRPHQAVALKEAVERQGLLAPIGVGKGKTLIGFLMATVFESMRPMLVLQAGLIRKAERNWADLAIYWQIPNWIKIISYEILGRVSAKEELERFSPDLIVFDEVHKIKSRKAAVSKRVERHVEHHRYHETGTKHPHCDLCDRHVPPRALIAEGRRTALRVIGMSGTITTKSLKDFTHIAFMCVPENAPVPDSWAELETWRLALDEGVNPVSRVEPGALLAFCDERETGLELTTAARRGYQRRLRETPGIVATTDDTVRASLQIDALEAPKSAAIDDAFTRLRGDTRKHREGGPNSGYNGWQLPDGYECVDGVEVYRHALELALGFFYVWDPRPPPEWILARALWGKFVRKTIKLGKLDSDLDVANHAHEFHVTVDMMLKEDDLDPHKDPRVGARHVYDHWRELRDTYQRNQRAVWICDSVLKQAKAWLDSHSRGILWTRHIAFGNRLSEVSGYPYFGQEGLDASGRLIDDARGPIIASLDANKTGRDLQFNWSDNLFMTAMADGAECEQAFARTHRDGQDEDTVGVSLFVGCIEHVGAFETAQSKARYIEDITGQPQKLNFADVVVPSVLEIENRAHPNGCVARWDKEKQ